MNISEAKTITVPEIALIAATLRAIGFGAGLLLAGKFKRRTAKNAGMGAAGFRPGKYDSDCAACVRQNQ